MKIVDFKVISGGSLEAEALASNTPTIKDVPSTWSVQ